MGDLKYNHAKASWLKSFVLIMLMGILVGKDMSRPNDCLGMKNIWLDRDENIMIYNLVRASNLVNNGKQFKKNQIMIQPAQISIKKISKEK
jgi:hypothetical protein